jgi:hypothetical protein
VLNRISCSTVTLDLGDLEFFEQTIVSHASGKGCTGTQQKSVHHNRLAFFSKSETFLPKSSIFPAIPLEINPPVVCSQLVIFPMVLVKVIFLLITAVGVAVVILLLVLLSIYLGIRWF